MMSARSHKPLGYEQAREVVAAVRGVALASLTEIDEEAIKAVLRIIGPPSARAAGNPPQSINVPLVNHETRRAPINVHLDFAIAA